MPGRARPVHHRSGDRDRRRRQFGFFKGKDGALTLGPYLVTADELEPYRTPDGLLDLTLRAWVNGDLLASGNVVTLEAEGIGRVSNKVNALAPAPEIPKARRGQPRGPRH